MGNVFGSGASSFFSSNLDRDYEVQRIRHGRRVPIGSGTMGEVWPATHRKSRELRVVKSIQKSRIDDSSIVKNEIKALQMLQDGENSKGIIRYFEFFEDKERWHLIFEFLPKTLEDLLDTERKNRDEPQILMWVTQMVESVYYLHYGCQIVHRDIKPSNWLVGRNQTVKLADFGVCYLSESTKKSVLRDLFGPSGNAASSSGGGGSPARRSSALETITGVGQDFTSTVTRLSENPLSTIRNVAADYFSAFTGADEDAQEMELLRELQAARREGEGAIKGSPANDISNRSSPLRARRPGEFEAASQGKGNRVSNEDVIVYDGNGGINTDYYSHPKSDGTVFSSMTGSQMVGSQITNTMMGNPLSTYADSTLPPLKLEEIVGTPAYMSPEQHRLLLKHKNSHYGFKVDVWAIGVIVYILFTNKHPFRSRGHQAGETILIAGKTIQKTMVMSEELDELDINGELSMLHLYNAEFDWRGSSVPKETRNFIASCCYPCPSQRWDISKVKGHEWLGGDLAVPILSDSDKLVPFGTKSWVPYDRVPHGNGFVNPVHARWAADPRQGCLMGCAHDLQVDRARRNSEILVISPTEAEIEQYRNTKNDGQVIEQRHTEFRVIENDFTRSSLFAARY